MISALPADFPASIFFVLHTSPDSPGVLPNIVARTASLPSQYPADGARIEPGRIYLAPPDYHLLVKNGSVRVLRGPKENRHRPAIDPLFRTAARAYGSRVIGVLLSGVMDDGTAGLHAIKHRGGIAIVQEPKEAAYSQMPSSAIAHVDVDYVLPAAEIAPMLMRLVGEPAAPSPPLSIDMEKEARIAEVDMDVLNDSEKPGNPSPFACPECDGVLWEIQEEGLDHFRCRVGHSYSSETILAAKEEAVEAALWAALRALEESAALARRSAERSARRKLNAVAARYRERAETTQEHGRLLRHILLAAPPAETREETAEPEPLTGTQ